MLRLTTLEESEKYIFCIPFLFDFFQFLSSGNIRKCSDYLSKSGKTELKIGSRKLSAKTRTQFFPKFRKLDHEGIRKKIEERNVKEIGDTSVSIHRDARF